MADKYLATRSASDKAQEAALAALAEDVRGELGKVTEAHAGSEAAVAGAERADRRSGGGSDARADGRGERGGAGREAGEVGWRQMVELLAVVAGVRLVAGTDLMLLVGLLRVGLCACRLRWRSRIARTCE